MDSGADAGVLGPCTASEAVRVVTDANGGYRKVSLEASATGFLLAAFVEGRASLSHGSMYMLDQDGTMIGALEDDDIVTATVSTSADHDPRFYYTTSGDCYSASSVDITTAELVTGERSVNCGSGRWASSAAGSIVAEGSISDGARVVIVSVGGDEEVQALPDLFLADTMAHSSSGFAVAAVGAGGAGMWEVSFGSEPIRSLETPGNVQLRLGGEQELWQFSLTTSSASVALTAGGRDLGRINFRGGILSEDATRGRLAVATWADLDNGSLHVSVFGASETGLWAQEAGTWLPSTDVGSGGVGVARNGADVLVVWSQGHDLWARSLRCSP